MLNLHVCRGQNTRARLYQKLALVFSSKLGEDMPSPILLPLE